MVTDELVKAKSECYHSKLSEADNHKNVYSIANGLLLGPTMQKFPPNGFSYANDIAVHGLQTKQYGVITSNDR